MSCDNGNCTCGADCKCGSGCKCGEGCNCKGYGMYPDLTEKDTTFQIMVVGVAPPKGYLEEVEGAAVSENGGCKCGSNCTCDPCNCK